MRKQNNHFTPSDNHSVESKVKPKKRDKRKGNNKICFYLNIILLILFFILSVCFYVLSNKEQMLDVFWGFLSEKIITLVFAIIVELIVWFLGGAFLKKKVKDTLWILVCVVIISLCFVQVCGIMKLKSEVYKEKRLSHNNDETNDEKNSAKGNNTIIESGEIEYVKAPYIFEADPFFTEKREEYFGIKKGSLDNDDEIIKYIHNVLLEDMKAAKTKETNIPKSYENHTQAAELLYSTYAYQRDRDWLEKVTYAINVSKNSRIRTINDAIDERKKADEAYEDSENRRMISIYYKDLGDEYVKDNNQETASANFEDSAKWAMKAMYVAYRDNDYKKMKEIYNQLDNTLCSLEELKEINSERTADIRLCCDAYELIADECSDH